MLKSVRNHARPSSKDGEKDGNRIMFAEVYYFLILPQRILIFPERCGHESRAFSLLKKEIMMKKEMVPEEHPSNVW